MPPERRQAERILRTLDAGWAAFQESYAGLPDAALLEPGVAGDWSVKDVLAHVHTWQEEALAHLPVIAAGRAPSRYATTFGGIDAFNAQMAERKRDLALSEVRRRVDETHHRLVRLISSVPEDQLTGETRFRRRLRLDTYGHYRLHARGIREWRARSDAVLIEFRALASRDLRLNERARVKIATRFTRIAATLAPPNGPASLNVRVEEAQVVHVPRERVFQTFNDYDAWPKFSPLFRRVTVIERAENTVRVSAEVSVMGRTTSRTEKHVLTPPEQVLVSGETEGATNTTLWKFAPIAEGTLVTAVVEAELNGLTRLLGPLAKRQLRRLLRDWLRGLAKYAEAE